MKKYLYMAVSLLTLFATSCKKENSTINGHEYVDLGLPSGTKWATMNVGAQKPTDYGDYYAWGETETKSEYSLNTYMGMSSDEDFGTDKDPLKDYVTNLKSIADTKYDVAYVKWGGKWKMPTEEQIDELLSYCTTELTEDYNGTGVAGCIIKSKVLGFVGNSIFLPAAGYRFRSLLYNEGSFGRYWSATPDGDNANYACGLYFDSGDFYLYYYNRYVGRPVRPVSK